MDNASTNRVSIANAMGFGDAIKENVPPSLERSLSEAFGGPRYMPVANYGYPQQISQWAAATAAAATMQFDAVLIPRPMLFTTTSEHALADQLGLMPGAPPAPPVIPRDRDPSLVINFGRARRDIATANV